MAKKRSSSLRGRVVAHNISPKGRVEGILVEGDDGFVQVNYPKHGADELAQRVPVDSTVELAVELENDEDGDHPVYVTKDGPEEVTGVVTRFNYALHGEINGYHLDSGVFVHTKPDGAKRYKVRVGDTIWATGEHHKGADAVVVEAERVKKLVKSG